MAKLFIFACAWLAVSALTYGDPPAWWASRGVRLVDGQTLQPLPADDFRILNQGQLKNLATAAYDELEANLAGGAGPAVTALVKSWFELDETGDFQREPSTGARIPRGGAADGYATVNCGQLKNTAKPFYDRFIALGILPTTPWGALGKVPDDYALANLGEAKNLFQFTATQVDSDGDGLPDWFELTIGTNPSGAPKTGSTHAVGWDTDGDGIPDRWELQFGLSPTASDSFSIGPDGISYLVEFQNGTSPFDHAPMITLMSPANAVVIP